MTTVKSRYDTNKCAVCGKAIATGELMVWDKTNRKCYCMNHNPEKTKAANGASKPPVQQKPVASKPAVQQKAETVQLRTSAPIPMETVASYNAFSPSDVAILAACDALIAAAKALKTVVEARQ